MTWIARALFLLAVVWTGLFVEHAFLSSPAAQAPVEVLINASAGVAGAAMALRDARIIPTAWEYRLYAVFDARVRTPHSGTYVLRPGMNYRALARVLEFGPDRVEVSVRAGEGWTVDDIATHLAAEDGVAQTRTADSLGRSADRQAFDRRWRASFAFLKDLPDSRSLEGYLFPDTYRVWKDELPEALVQKQLAAFERRFGSVAPADLPAPLHTLDEAVRLASVVEAEVPDEHDRRIVAGIFLRRLALGMRLESDATVRYVTGSHLARSSARDLQSVSPYNSYRQAGLPPSPINNPGESSIRAVLQPAKTSYLYFLTNTNGQVLYAKTLAEHARNRRKAGY